MVTVSITRYALESDPLQVIIAGAKRQAVGGREARRLGLRADYQSHGDFGDLFESLMMRKSICRDLTAAGTSKFARTSIEFELLDRERSEQRHTKKRASSPTSGEPMRTSMVGFILTAEKGSDERKTYRTQ